MVIGLEVLREAFKDYEDCYTIIGGTACDILMSRQNLDFRATKDIDMILLIENRFEEFGTVLWKFIKDGHTNVAGRIQKTYSFIVLQNHRIQTIR